MVTPATRALAAAAALLAGAGCGGSAGPQARRSPARLLEVPVHAADARIRVDVQIPRGWHIFRPRRGELIGGAALPLGRDCDQLMDVYALDARRRDDLVTAVRRARRLPQVREEDTLALAGRRVRVRRTIIASRGQLIFAGGATGPGAVAVARVGPLPAGSARFVNVVTVAGPDGPCSLRARGIDRRRRQATRAVTAVIRSLQLRAV